MLEEVIEGVAGHGSNLLDVAGGVENTNPLRILACQIEVALADALVELQVLSVEPIHVAPLGALAPCCARAATGQAGGASPGAPASARRRSCAG